MSVDQLDQLEHRVANGNGKAVRPARVPPHDLRAEASLLGAMFMSTDAIAAAVQACTAEDFYKPAHGHIFDAIISLYGAGEPADPITVSDELTRAGLLEAIGGPAVLTTLQAGTPSTSNAPHYARIVQEMALLRRTLATTGEIAELVYDLPDDVDEFLDRAESMIFDIAERRVSDTVKPVKQLMHEALDDIEQQYERGGGILGVATGFHDLDALLSGLRPSNLILVGARPSMGKTSFGLSIAAQAAIDGGVPTLFASLEMSHKEITTRLLCAEARVSSTRVRDGHLQEADWPKIHAAMGRLADAPLFIDDDPNLTVMELRAKARRLGSRVGRLGLVVVDYLQLMSGRRNAETRQVEISEISRGLKILARELECPVLALSQLSRNLEMRADKRPVLSDLRESGALEQDSDVVIFLYRDEIYNPASPDRGCAEVHVAKHRNGPTNNVQLAFLDHYTKFANMARV